MAITKGPTEGGSGGKRGHSNMEHWDKTEVLKHARRAQRRQQDKYEITKGLIDTDQRARHD